MQVEWSHADVGTIRHTVLNRHSMLFTLSSTPCCSCASGRTLGVQENDAERVRALYNLQTNLLRGAGMNARLVYQSYTQATHLYLSCAHPHLPLCQHALTTTATTSAFAVPAATVTATIAAAAAATAATTPPLISRHTDQKGKMRASLTSASRPLPDHPPLCAAHYTLLAVACPSSSRSGIQPHATRLHLWNSVRSSLQLRCRQHRHCDARPRGLRAADVSNFNKTVLGMEHPRSRVSLVPRSGLGFRV